MLAQRQTNSFNMQKFSVIAIALVNAFLKWKKKYICMCMLIKIAKGYEVFVTYCFNVHNFYFAHIFARVCVCNTPGTAFNWLAVCKWNFIALIN